MFYLPCGKIIPGWKPAISGLYNNQISKPEIDHFFCTVPQRESTFSTILLRATLTHQVVDTNLPPYWFLKRDSCMSLPFHVFASLESLIHPLGTCDHAVIFSLWIACQLGNGTSECWQASHLAFFFSLKLLAIVSILQLFFSWRKKKGMPVKTWLH